VDNGADINHATYIGNTALIFASRRGHTGSVELLINAGADLNHASNLGGTALIFANDRGHTETVAFLENHANRLTEVATFIESRAAFDEVGNVLRVDTNPIANLEDEEGQQRQNLLLEDSKRFNRNNIKDALASKLLDDGIDEVTADQKADKIIGKILEQEEIVKQTKEMKVRSDNPNNRKVVIGAKPKDGNSKVGISTDLISKVSEFLSNEDHKKLIASSIKPQTKTESVAAAGGGSINPKEEAIAIGKAMNHQSNDHRKPASSPASSASQKKDSPRR